MFKAIFQTKLLTNKPKIRPKNKYEKLTKKRRKKGKVSLFLRTFLSVIANLIIPIIEINESNKSNKVRLPDPSFTAGKSRTNPNKNNHPLEKLLEKIKIANKSVATKTVAKTFSVKTKFSINIIKPMKIGKIELFSKPPFTQFKLSVSQVICFIDFC
jgi:hypothetical protein